MSATDYFLFLTHGNLEGGYMAENQTPAGLPPTENFECCWCKEAKLEDFIYPPDEYGGWDQESKLPICIYCAEAAQEEMEAEAKYQ